MNIFWLDTNLEKCAQAHYDKHIVKMPIEYAQLLSTTLLHHGYEAPYKKTHENHPCAKWARKHKGNYQLLWDLADAVGREYTHRYGKIHKSHQLLLDGLIPREIDTGEDTVIRSPLPNCTDIEEYPQHYNQVQLYRIYYCTSKAHLNSYKNREEPDWMGDRFYQQQLGLNKPKKDKNAAPKPTKADLAVRLGHGVLEKLLAKDLELLSPENFKGKNLTMPEGRLKKPYIEECKKIHPDVDWSKLTIASLKELLK